MKEDDQLNTSKIEITKQKDEEKRSLIIEKELNWKKFGVKRRLFIINFIKLRRRMYFVK
jgi:hypothetical protein